MSSSAMSAAGKAPEELKPYCPKDVMSMNVKLCDDSLDKANEPLGVEITQASSKRGIIIGYRYTQ